MSKKKKNLKCRKCLSALAEVVTGVDSDGNSITFLLCGNNWCEFYGVITNSYC